MHRGREYTEKIKVCTIISVIGIKPNASIHDPAAGTGSFLAAAEAYLRRLYPKGKLGCIVGTEITQDLCLVANIHFYLQNFKAALVRADSLNGSGPFQDQLFDCILCTPPLFVSQVLRIDPCLDHRWYYHAKDNHFTRVKF